MFGLWRRQSQVQSNPAFKVPDGVRVYAVGDVHGCLAELDRMLDMIGRERPSDLETHLVFLGDLVDRGPNSRGVVDRLQSGRLPADRCTFLMGNHEQAMLEVLDGDVGTMTGWLSYGGLQTLESYGIGRAEILQLGTDLPRRMREVVPAAHVRFIRSFQDSERIGDYLFVHAGIRPGIPLGSQDSFDLRWIRGDFLTDEDTDHGAMVVHGHTISEEPEVRANRIGIDTGCYASGRLTALVLEGAERRFLCT